MRYLICIGLALTLIHCSPPPCDPPQLPPPGSKPAAGPLMAVAESDNRFVFYPANGEAWSNLVDMSLFSGFFPGISLKQAKMSHGDPDTHGKNSLGEYWRYERPEGVVQIGLEDQSSPPFLLPDVWVLRGVPSNPAPDKLVHPSIAAYLPRGASGRVEAIIMNNCGYPGVEVVLEDDRVVMLTWVKNTGSQ